MGKSPDAFRTITEVSDWLETPTHVLRFWETKFPALKPVKRAGGRRYYRPGDMALLAGIKALLHEQGMSIKGVQKLLRERGPRHVAGQSPLPWDAETMDAVAWEPPEAPPGGPPAAGPAAELRDDMPAPAEAMREGLAEAAGEADDFDLPAPPTEPEGEEALTFLDAVLVGTARRMREGAPMAQGEDHEEAPPEVVSFPEPVPEGARAEVSAPTPHGPATGGAAPGARPCERLLMLLRHADRSLLRARADRIAPLVARLDALRRTGTERSPGPLRARGESL